ncbi:MAG: L-aspartate oxidase [bacterium]|nr:L-aspartate oxidase [Myxococcales bacterium]MCB9550733.1 L-aspartate oxidase [Myxococcales bacterium]
MTGLDRDVDVLVLGSGIAGLSFALEAARHGRVLIVTKREIDEANTRYAQGGISSVLGADDSFAEHVEDTLVAGAGLCKKHVVELCVQDGPAAVRRLAEWGVSFDRDGDGGYDLGREGGHSKRRVLHAGDITGAEIQRALTAGARRHPNIEILEHHHGVDLITSAKHLRTGGPNRCLGAYVLDVPGRRVLTVRARCTVLATGGAGKVYKYTSNPPVATGDGVAMAHRAGARVANLEFFQFHPTCLYHPQANSFLVSEALRGEGGELRLLDGTPFMKRYHELGSLAPRDIVARAIDNELKRRGEPHVLLDMTHLEGDFLAERFPNIHARCLELGLDMRSAPIPVVPAAHYMCGGVQTDIDARTSVHGLYAIGEVACTGLHGANRLASNSLLEGVVFADRAVRAVEAALADSRGRPADALPTWEPGDAREPDEVVIITQNWKEIRQLMWNYVGIVRSDRRLARARARIDLLRDEIHEYYWDYRVTPDLLELRNLALVAELTIRCARLRKESRGLHYTIDHPARHDGRFGVDTVLDGQ